MYNYKALVNDIKKCTDVYQIMTERPQQVKPFPWTGH